MDVEQLAMAWDVGEMGREGGIVRGREAGMQAGRPRGMEAGRERSL